MTISAIRVPFYQVKTFPEREKIKINVTPTKPPIQYGTYVETYPLAAPF